jgi:hypothetical protein
MLIGNVQMAQAACNSYVTTPADGIIAAGSTITNSQSDACFQDTTVPIVNNGTVHNNQGAYGVTNPGTLTNAAAGKFINEGGIVNSVGATLTNKGTFDNHFVSFSGYLSNQGTLINTGVLNNDVSSLNNYGSNAKIINDGSINNAGAVWLSQGSSLTGVGTFTQSNYANAVTQVDGVMTQSVVSFSSGKLDGSGAINAAVSFTGGTLEPAYRPQQLLNQIPKSTLDINGSLSMTNSTLLIDIFSASYFYALNVTGSITLDSGNTLAFDFRNGAPKVGDSWKFLTGDTSSLSLTGLNLTFTGANGANFGVSNVNDGLVLTTLQYAPPSVPVPAAAWLFGSGLIGLIGAVRKRKSA